MTTKQLPFLECFSSETRIRIIEMLNERPMNIKEMAAALNLSSAIVTKHVQKMEEAGIIASDNRSGVRGMQKVCSLKLDQAVLQLRTDRERETRQYEISIPVGQYYAAQVKPTCGLASVERIIGLVDDPRYFADPAHVQAGLLWFGSGFVKYRVPNYLLGNQAPRSVEVSLEICSEAPNFNETWPSDISFSLNGIPLGTWTCPGDFGSKRGVFTPDWWKSTQYGLMKSIAVRQDGTYLDGVKLSGVTVRDLGLTPGPEIELTIACEEQAAHCGGVTLFGAGFGNYNQDIRVVVGFENG